MEAAGFCPGPTEAALEKGLTADDLRELTVGELIDFLQHHVGTVQPSTCRSTPPLNTSLASRASSKATPGKASYT